MGTNAVTWVQLSPQWPRVGFTCQTTGNLAMSEWYRPGHPWGMNWELRQPTQPSPFTLQRSAHGTPSSSMEDGIRCGMSFCSGFSKPQTRRGEEGGEHIEYQETRPGIPLIFAGLHQGSRFGANPTLAQRGQRPTMSTKYTDSNRVLRSLGGRQASSWGWAGQSGS